MRASTGVYYEKLDHIRAFAAFLVFSWHFVHTNGIVETTYVPSFGPFSLFEEGHTGVGLFMVLSGYLFAKLINEKEIDYGAFLWNRFIRLAPLLFVVLLVAYAIRVKQGLAPLSAVQDFLSGFILPDWPNGGWSLTVELHFYLVLPFLLKHIRRNPFIAIYLVLGMVCARYFIYWQMGQLQYLSYWTLVGRIDQFTLGIFTFYAGRNWKPNTPVFLLSAASFLTFMYSFNFHGGFYNKVSYPSTDPIWIVFPTIEGAFYSLLILYYDNIDWSPTPIISRAVSFVGKISYSIYLVHFFIVFRMASLFVRYVVAQPSYGTMLLASVGAFILTLPFAWLSNRFIETSLMRFRTKYTRSPSASARGLQAQA